MSSDGLSSSKIEILEINENPSVDETTSKSITAKFITYLQECTQNHTSEIRKMRNAIINFAFGVYFAWATYHFIDLKNQNGLQQNKTRETTTYEPTARCEGYCGIQWCNGYGLLLILTVIVYTVLLLNEIAKTKWLKNLHSRLKDATGNFKVENHQKILWTIAIVVGALFLFIDTSDSRDRLRSLSGIFILYGLGFLFSKNMNMIHWRAVIVGFLLQFLLGLFCIRMDFGRRIFSCIGHKVTTFLNYARVGSQFVYGDLLINEEHVLAFSVLTVIYLTSFCISILYYWGVMQWVVQKLGAPLRVALGTTVCESMAAASNIFFGLSDTMLMIRPFVKRLTASEIHAIMTSCFATVAGDVLAAYIKFGAEASHLITSSIMAAPAALCFGKLFYPETEKSQTTIENCVMEKSTDTSALEAASNGATTATQIILGIVGNLVAFVSFIAFANGITHWLGYLIGYDYLSFELFFAKLFIPLSYIIGIPWDDCEKIGQVIATKTIVNEFVAYKRLGDMKRNGEISLRSSAIATFAVCGFANPGSLGILIGMITTICPDKQKIAASVGLRAFIAGSFVNFINASIAGLLMPAYLYEGISVNMTNASTESP